MKASLIDTHVNLGDWPFTLAPGFTTATTLSRHLTARGVSHAVVSHFGAVFQPDPVPSNQWLFNALCRSAKLTPLPIINLRLANWREQLAQCQSLGVPAVKLTPTYHNYTLADPVLEPFMATLRRAKLRLVIQVRYQDERHHYFALAIKGIPNAELAAFLSAFPSQHPLLLGTTRPDLKALAVTHPNFSADISFCEWIDTVADLLTAVPARRLLLGTGTPLFSTRGNADKLRLADIPAKTKALIGTANAQRFFKF